VWDGCSVLARPRVLAEAKLWGRCKARECCNEALASQRLVCCLPCAGVCRPFVFGVFSQWKKEVPIFVILVTVCIVDFLRPWRRVA